MALPWLAALKLVPWGDVIEATPKLVKHAKKLFGRTQQPAAPAAPPVALTADPATLAAVVAQLQARTQALEAERQSAAEVLADLAEQHARVVQAVDALQRRTRRLAVACLALAVLGGVALARSFI